jgi:DNA-binding NarL/FixJ family response regulator
VLTNKEVEVLKQVAHGATNKEIASSLNISDNTVKYHLRNIMEKLNVKNRAQIAAYAVMKGITLDDADGQT